ALDALSINLSGQTLNDVGFMDFLRQEFRNYRVSPQRVCFEVTETAAVANLSLAADMIREFKHMGCRFALDDFGSGLSSYAYLKNLPADYLKFDGEFIRELDRPDADDAMVKSIHELGHHLGKLTVAEFVETDRVRERLATIGMDYVQGFSVHRPVPLEALGVIN
ncbi:MAG: EAL domain-containing protein, partial [Ectothiorhodospiraceae bacterium]|nr:EAL domain-containing protein [Ectothiorhodospiraceae bacterium]